MLRKLKIGVTILLLLIVAYIFVLPAFDLDPTALRAMRLAALVFISIAAAASALDFTKPAQLPLALAHVGAAPPSLDITDLTCISLC